MPAAGAEHHLVFFGDPPYFGGAEGYVAMLAQGRPAAGWQLSALLPIGGGGDELAGLLTHAGVTVHRYRLRSPLDPRLWVEVGRRLRGIGGQILHMNLPWVYGSCVSVPALLAKLAGYRRVVTTEHLPMVERARKRMILKLLLVPFIDAIIVHTDWNRRILGRKHRMPLGRMHVIPNGSSESPVQSAEERGALRRELGLSPDQTALVVVGRLTERKGHRFLLEALARLAARAPERAWRLLVVGNGEEEQALQEQAERLGIAGQVVFLGHRTDARAIIHAADLLVLASLLETQPLVITEAMASGLPVIVSGIYGIPEIVEDGVTGRLVPPGEVEPLARAIEELLSDSQMRARMGRAARRRYEEKFTLERMARRTYEVLEGSDRRGTAR
jgi:glycosyltransferase involved in cell wall biosynthesis